MKILLIAKPWKGGLGRYFYRALRDMFPGNVEWIATRPQTLSDRLRFRRNPETWRQSLIRKINAGDHMAAVFIGHQPGFGELRPSDRNVLYLIDDARLMPGDAEVYGRVFLADPGYLPELLAAVPAGKSGGVLPFAHHPAVHRPVPFDGHKQDLCFIGNRDAKRNPYLAALFAANLRPRIVGNYFLNSPLFWAHPASFRPAVANDRMAALYARHKLTFNIHAQVVRQGTNMRTFECAGYEIPQVVEYRADVERYFAPDEEILCCRDSTEMIAQIRALLSDPARAGQMAQKARRRALAEHTYHHRAAAMLRDILPPRELQIPRRSDG